MFLKELWQPIPSHTLVGRRESIGEKSERISHPDSLSDGNFIPSRNANGATDKAKRESKISKEAEEIG